VLNGTSISIPVDIPKEEGKPMSNPNGPQQIPPAPPVQNSQPRVPPQPAQPQQPAYQQPQYQQPAYQQQYQQQPYQQQPQYQQQYVQQPYAPAPPTNLMSIFALISAFVLPFVVPIILGHISLSQIKRTGEGGRGMAIAALIIGYIEIAFWLIWALVLIIIFAAAGASGAFDSSYY